MIAGVTMKCCAGLVLLCLVIGPGCASREPTTRPMTARERQADALHDPMNYKPGMDEHDISGGDVGNFDRKGMKRDIDHVLNP
jgi:hypothetical protein